ncbi:MAG: alpha/beta hydrolase [Nitrospiraceae bacterium]
MKVKQLGGLKVWLTGGTDGCGGGDGPVVVLLHGWGAPGDDLVPLGQEIDAPRGTRFVFPEAPLSLQMGFGDSRGWWMLDIEKRQREIAAGRARDLSREVPKGLAEARAKVIALLDELERRAGARQIVLGGFSQGAMLACDVALRTGTPLAGLVLLSGTLLAADEWTPLMPKRKGLKVFQSHGSADPLLPYFIAEQLRDVLKQGGLSVDWVSFRGGHEIPGTVLDRLGAFLRTVLAS